MRGHHWPPERVIAACGHRVPLLPRALVRYFGSDCLPYMPDEEIARFQLLDDYRHEAQAEGREFSYERERAGCLACIRG